jgi:hypothetical protein
MMKTNDWAAERDIYLTEAGLALAPAELEIYAEQISARQQRLKKFHW